MTRSLLAFTLFLGFSSSALAQHGEVKLGYFPVCYAGDTWTGSLTGVDDEKHELTLSYTDEKHNKTESFVGVLEDGYTVKERAGQPHLLKPSEFRLGTLITVFYCKGSKKLEGKKTPVNTIFEMDKAPNLKVQYKRYMAF